MIVLSLSRTPFHFNWIIDQRIHWRVHHPAPCCPWVRHDRGPKRCESLPDRIGWTPELYANTSDRWRIGWSLRIAKWASHPDGRLVSLIGLNKGKRHIRPLGNFQYQNRKKYSSRQNIESFTDHGGQQKASNRLQRASQVVFSSMGCKKIPLVILLSSVASFVAPGKTLF